MSRHLSKILRESAKATDDTGMTLAYWCPGCKHAHMVSVTPGVGPRWSYNFNHDSPTLAPSVRHFFPEHKNYEGEVQPEKTFCHYFIKNGMFEFCGDCSHEFSGQTVAMPPWPYKDDDYEFAPAKVC